MSALRAGSAVTGASSIAAFAAILVRFGGIMAQEIPGGTAGWETDFSRHTVPLEEIVPGGPAKDGIPSIDDPEFVDVRTAEAWLEAGEPVIVVERDGVARAYPYQILIWHEIVNDEVRGLPLAVTYCPLCNTALVFRREHEGRVLDFGTTGRLRHSDLVMYDRQSESWWQQATGEAIVGRYAGDRLTPYPAQTTSWATFRNGNPDGEVLARPEEYDRPYGENPYEGYDRRRNPIASFFGKGDDDRLPAMERVVAVHRDGASVAVPFSRLRKEQVVSGQLRGAPLVVFWSPGTASALDASTVPGGRDVGATGVFFPEAAGRRLTFEPAGDGRYRDRQTGSTWTLLGRAIAGPLQGERLTPVSHGDYLWFAWAAFRPETEIWK